MSGQGIGADRRLRGRPASRSRYPLGHLDGPGVHALGARDLARSSAGSCACSGADPARSRTGRATPSRCSSSASSSRRVLYALLRLQGHLFLNPDHLKGVPCTHRPEHGRELRHEHQLAVLRRRVHDVVPDARWPGSRCRTSSRPPSAWPCWPPSSAASPAARRERLGNFWRDLYRSIVYILLPLAIVLAVILLSQGVVQTFHGHATATTLQGAHADDRARPGRLADRHQAARHERRRLLQLELVRAVREPDRALELPRDARDPADPGGQVFMFGRMVLARSGTPWAIVAADVR